tara:strand:- start:8781 stop:9131 length:351 start_codon:yes stop_codon:yes gene_type:complete
MAKKEVTSKQNIKLPFLQMPQDEICQYSCGASLQKSGNEWTDVPLNHLRWWFEAFSPHPDPQGKALLAWYHLAGTLLTAPADILSVLNLLPNYSKVMETIKGQASSSGPLLIGEIS